MTTDAQKRATAKWQSENTKSITIRFMPGRMAEYEAINSKPNKTAYILDLVADDIADKLGIKDFKRNEFGELVNNGSWIEHGTFGRDTYGLHTIIDGREYVARVGESENEAKRESRRILARISAGWKPIN